MPKSWRTRLDWSKVELGLVPDSVLARRHGVANATIRQAREFLKLPAPAPWSWSGRLVPEIVLEHLNRYPKSMSVLLQDILDDYGSYSERQLYRVLKKLKALGQVSFVKTGSLKEWGFVRLFDRADTIVQSKSRVSNTSTTGEKNGQAKVSSGSYERQAKPLQEEARTQARPLGNRKSRKGGSSHGQASQGLQIRASEGQQALPQDPQEALTLFTQIQRV